MPDIDAPVTAVALLLAVLAVLIMAIAMDMRRLPLGRVKYVPWTYITITALFGLMLAGRHALLVLTG